MDTSNPTLEFDLIRRYDRPSFEYSKTLFLMDSGANMPVWCSGEKLFLDTYPSAKKTDFSAHISGFGNGFTEADVYLIPEFTLGNVETILSIKNLHVAVTEKTNIGFDFLLSSTMFSKADSHYLNSAGKIIFELYAGDTFICTPISDSEVFKKIAVWIQDLPTNTLNSC